MENSVYSLSLLHLEKNKAWEGKISTDSKPQSMIHVHASKYMSIVHDILGSGDSELKFSIEVEERSNENMKLVIKQIISITKVIFCTVDLIASEKPYHNVMETLLKNMMTKFTTQEEETVKLQTELEVVSKENVLCRKELENIVESYASKRDADNTEYLQLLNTKKIEIIRLRAEVAQLEKARASMESKMSNTTSTNEGIINKNKMNNVKKRKRNTIQSVDSKITKQTANTTSNVNVTMALTAVGNTVSVDKVKEVKRSEGAEKDIIMSDNDDSMNGYSTSNSNSSSDDCFRLDSLTNHNNHDEDASDILLSSLDTSIPLSSKTKKYSQPHRSKRRRKALLQQNNVGDGHVENVTDRIKSGNNNNNNNNNNNTPTQSLPPQKVTHAISTSASVQHCNSTNDKEHETSDDGLFDLL